jgi:DNA replication and repair protein RecF
MVKRAEFAAFLARSASAIYSELTSGGEDLSVVYRPTIESGEERETAGRLKEALAGRRDVDVSRGTTTVGPHRDDLAMCMGGLSARDYASQGQQRSAAVALKLAEIEMMETASGEPPVLLLDDVTAELDPERRARVIRLAAGRCQTFLTTTRLEELQPADLDSAAVFEVRSGKVTPK